MILFLGGQSSGKSALALQFCQRYATNNPLHRFFFIATAQYPPQGDDDDNEIKQRIIEHQQERRRSGINWELIEEPLDFTTILSNKKKNDVVLLDCFSMIINNLIYEATHYHDQKKKSENQWNVQIELEIQQKISQLVQCCRIFSGNLVVVTLEAGLGNIAIDPLSRLYNKVLGWANQQLARYAKNSYLVVAGCPLPLRRPEKIWH